MARKIKVAGAEFGVKDAHVCSLKSPRYRKPFSSWNSLEKDRILREVEDTRSGGIATSDNPLFINKNPKRMGVVIGPYPIWIISRAMGIAMLSVVYLDVPDKETEKELGEILDRVLLMKESKKDLERLEEIMRICK